MLIFLKTIASVRRFLKLCNATWNVKMLFPFRFIESPKDFKSNLPPWKTLEKLVWTCFANKIFGRTLQLKPRNKNRFMNGSSKIIVNGVVNDVSHEICRFHWGTTSRVYEQRLWRRSSSSSDEFYERGVPRAWRLAIHQHSRRHSLRAESLKNVNHSRHERSWIYQVLDFPLANIAWLFFKKLPEI